MNFIFHEDILQLGVRGQYFVLYDLHNRGSSDEDVLKFVDTALRDVHANHHEERLAGFRRIHAAVSSKAKKMISSPEMLRSLFVKKGGMPRINGLVDVYNAVSLTSGLALGAHDLDQIGGDIHLRSATGTERFCPIGSPDVLYPANGEYIYVDDANDVLCRLEVRQCEKSKVTMDTKNVFFIVQGHDEVSPEFLNTVASDLKAACLSLFGGSVRSLYPPQNP